MKNIFLKFLWGFFWLFFGVFVAFQNGITDPIKIAGLSIGFLILADLLVMAIRKILYNNKE